MANKTPKHTSIADRRHLSAKGLWIGVLSSKGFGLEATLSAIRNRIAERQNWISLGRRIQSPANWI